MADDPKENIGIPLEDVSGDRNKGATNSQTTKSEAQQSVENGKATHSEDEERPLVEKETSAHGAKTNIPLTSFNLIHSIIGSGIIGMPYAVKQGGIGLAIIFMIFIGLVTDYTLIILIKSGDHAKVTTYQDLMMRAFGPFGLGVITFAQFCFPVIAMTSYNILAGDVVSQLVYRVGGDALRNSVLAKREFDVFLYTVLITLPLSLYRDIGRLAKWSLLSTVFILLVGVIIFIRTFTLGSQIPVTDPGWSFANIGFPQTFAIMATAYICNHNSFLMYDSLEDATEKRWGTVVHSSIFFSMITMLWYALAGYLTFTGLTQGDLLQNYCYNDDLANAARVIFSFIMSLIYPVECFVARTVIENIFFPNSQPPPLWRHIVVTVSLVTFTLLVSMVTHCLGIVISLNGALTAVPMGFIFPCIAYMRVRPEPLRSWGNAVPIGVAVLGVVMLVLGVSQVVLEIVQGVSCTTGDNMPYCQKPFNYTALTNKTL